MKDKIVLFTDGDINIVVQMNPEQETVTNRRQIFSAEHLYESVWQETYYYGANNTVMVHMRNLRRKIERDPKNPTIIKTVWGRGYRCD